MKVIDLARNSGQHNALMAALRHADGDVIIGWMMMDRRIRPSSESFLKRWRRNMTWSTVIIRIKSITGSAIWEAGLMI